MENQIEQLTRRVAELERLLNLQGNNFEELIRDIVNYNQDLTTNRENIITLNIPAGGGTFLFGTAFSPDVYLRQYFRGVPYNIPGYIVP